MALQRPHGRSIQTPRMFVLGDSFSTIRRKIDGTTPESAANLNINGRFTATTGLNLWDYLSRSFAPPLTMGLTHNYAREGAMAVNDWRSTASWSAINPIPSVGSQFTSLTLDNPANSITSADIIGILIGTNDKVSDASSTTAADGGAKPTAQQTSDAIVNVVNRAISHNFRNIIVMFPESKWFGTVAPILAPALDTIAKNNRGVKIVYCYADSSILEFASPYHPDGLHPNDTTHKRLGEVLTDAWQQNQIIDRTQNFLISTKGSSTSNPREFGFQNFDPTATTGHYARMRIIDAFNCIEAQTNRGMTLRSYNGFNICGAWEGQDPIANGRIPVGGGKNDPVLRVMGNFWEHSPGLLTIENVAGSPAPAIMARTGGVDNFKVASDGAVTIAGSGQLNVDSPSRLQASRTVDQSFTGVSAYSFYLVTFPTTITDPYTQYTPANGRYTIKTGNKGFYFFHVGVSTNPYSSGNRRFYVSLFRNGVEFARIADSLILSAQFGNLIGCCYAPANVGDYFDVRIGTDIAANFGVLGAATVTFFNAIKLS